jgi:uncharacterized protein YbcV (DUF1398 family)
LERPSYLCKTSNQAVLSNCYKQNIHKVWKDLNFEHFYYEILSHFKCPKVYNFGG